MTLTSRGKTVVALLAFLAAAAVFSAFGPAQGPGTAAAAVQTTTPAQKAAVAAETAVPAPAPTVAAPKAKAAPESGSGEDNGGPEEAAEQVSASTKARIKAAVEAKYPGVTILEAEKNLDGGHGGYEAELSNGLEVELNAQFQITGTATDG